LKDKLPRQSGSLEAVYQVLESRLDASASDRRDGLRLDWPQAKKWLHLRPSGTEPIFRIIAEAPSADQARELIRLARQALENRAA
jgi:phosphomannomutase